RAGPVGVGAGGWPPDRRAHPLRPAVVLRGAEHDVSHLHDSGDAFETRAIHAGQAPDTATGAVVPPITLATTFAQEAVGKHRGYEYARSGNPTRAALETCLASLENARY